MSDTRTRRRSRALFVALTPLVMAASARAGATFSGSSTATIYHNADDFTPGRPSADKHVNPPPGSGSMPSYQYGGTLNFSGASTTADASVGAVTTSTITGFTLAPGTGVQQTDPSSVLHSSELEIAVNGIWNISGSRGPTATGYLSFTLAGTVGTGGSAAWSVDLNFTNASNTALCSPIVSGGSFSTGSFSTVFSSNTAFSPTALTNGSEVKITGTITLTANADDPTNVAMSDFELSNAPPTSRFIAFAGGGSISSAGFNVASNWSSAYTDPTTHVAQTIPNGVGDRAVFVGPTVNTGPVTLSQPTTLGTLDIDQPGINITGSNSAPLTFQTDASNPAGADHPCLLIRNVQGNSAHTIVGPIILPQTLEVENDSSGTASLGALGTVSGQGGIIVNGLGSLLLSTNNTYQGGTAVNSGAVYATVAGALGTGSVAVSGGLLNYNANGAAQAGIVVTVSNGGQVALGPGVTTPIADQFSVNDKSCISGTAAQLSALHNVPNQNLTLTAGAMIGHQTFDTDPASNNPTGLGNTPQYIFGISNNFTSGAQTISVGASSASPWAGFGGDRGKRTFGSDPATTLQSVTILGDAQLVSLGSQLVMNGAINGGDVNVTLTKRGAGLVSINNTNNLYAGAAVVQSGPLAVNGSFNPTSLTVQGGATLAGAGTIGSSVTLLDGPQNVGAHLSPGTLGDTPTFATAPFQLDTPGTLHTGALSLSANSQLDFKLALSNVVGGANNDLVVVNGNLVLDGVLNIDNAITFDPAGIYTLFQFTGSIQDNGLVLGNTPILSPREEIEIIQNVGGGGSVILAPEPSSLSVLFVTGCLLSCRRRRIKFPK